MKTKLTTVLMLAAFLCLVGFAQADSSWSSVSWTKVALDSLVNGAVSYDSTVSNVVVSGTAFYDTIHADGSYLGTQLIGGDGINEEVAGNMAIYGLFTYTDTANVLGSVMANPTQMLGFEIVANDLNIDFEYNGYGTTDLVDRYALDARDIDGIDFLKASFAEIAGHGYTQLAPGVWFDLAVTGDVPAGQVAMSIVIDGFQNDNFDALCAEYGLIVMNANLLPGQLALGTPGHVRDSGIFIAEVPEPATMALLSLGSLALLRKKRHA